MSTQVPASLRAEVEELRAEIRFLRSQYRETEDVVQAINQGEVDAVVVRTPRGKSKHAVYTFFGEDHQYRNFVEAMQEGAVTLSREGMILYCNPSFVSTLRSDVDRLLGESFARFVHPDEKAHFEAFLDQTGADKAEMTLVAENGTHVPAYLSRSEADLVGMPGICLVVTDLTEQKRHEEVVASEQLARAVLEQVNETLERRVAERTAELNQANRILIQRNRELQEFTYTASHDLQEPLRKINMFLGLFLAESGEGISEDGRLFLERTKAASTRMSTLIEALRDYSRVTTRANPIKEVDLRAVLDYVQAGLADTIARTSTRIVATDLPRIRADAEQVTQLLRNLITNAIKFRRPGVAPVIEVRAVVEQSSDPDGPPLSVRLEVEDNGMGFDEKHAERIFSPFGRLHGRSDGDGAGMGLAICRRIAERHGGSIYVRSTPGHGSTFVVMIPQP